MRVRPESVGAIALTLFCLMAVVYPLFAGPGPVNTRGGGDSPFLFIRLEQLVAGLRAGAFPVRWMPDAAYGLGYPFFNFYAALPYYIAALLRLCGQGTILSLQLTQALGFALSAAAMALLARRVFRRPAAVALATVAYACAPFHLVNVYVRGDSLSEFYAFVFYPLTLWSLLRLWARPDLPGVAWLGLSYGGLILTHNLSALIWSPFLGLAVVLLLLEAGQRERWRTAAFVLGGGMLGLAISATLWLTVVGDLRGVWMGVKDIQTSDFFNYASHFRGHDLLQPRLLFNYDLAGATPFAMGAVQGGAILLGIAVMLLFRRGGGIRWRSRLPVSGVHVHPPAMPVRPRWWAVLMIGGLMLSTVMITPLSYPAWAHVPVLPIVQFPWRFLSVQAFFGALIVGELGDRLPKPWTVMVVGALALTIAAVGGLHPEYLPIGDEDITPQRLALFELFTTNIGTTIRGEYLPVGVEPRPYSSAAVLRGLMDASRRPAPLVLEGEALARLVHHDAVGERWWVRVTSSEAHLAFYTLYFPGWQALVDGVSVAAGPLPNSGLVSLRVPRGEHEVVLRFGRTAVRRLADGISLVAVAVALVFLWPTIRRRWRCVGMVAVLTLIVAALASLPVGKRAFPADDLSMDFDRMPFLHHNPQGMGFERARLRGYDYAAEVRGGETLTVTLRWADRCPELTAELRLVSPADVHPAFVPPPPPLAQSRVRIDTPTTQHLLHVPADAASGLYFLSLRVFDGEGEVRAVNERGESLGITYLRPVRVINPRPTRGEERMLARFGERIVLYDARVEADGEGWTVSLTWGAMAPIPANYTCSLRMLATDGTPLAQRDFEGGPGYGFWPTTAWPVGELLRDLLRVAIPSGVDPADAAALSVVLYDRSQSGFPAVGSVIIPLVEREHRYDVPAMERSVGATFGRQIELLGYDLRQEGTSLYLTLYWRALRRVEGDYAIFVHLFDPHDEQIVAQWDARPQQGTYPTLWWRVGEVIAEQVVLSTEEAKDGLYSLGVGLYEPRSGRRLVCVTATGQVLEDGRLVLESVTGRR